MPAEQTKQQAPFGSWPSAVSADMMTSKGVGLAEPKIIDDEIYWLEHRPKEKGRCVPVAYNHGHPKTLLPRKYSVRSTVHEYGGGAWTIAGGFLYFVNQSDQQIYRCSLDYSATTVAIVEASDKRFADLQYHAASHSLIAVVEDHDNRHPEPRASIAIVSCEPQSTPRDLTSGADFYANPRLSPDGTELLWLQWNHPEMPWTKSELWRARLETGQLTDSRKIAGDQESIFQPLWSPEAQIYYVSDRNNWWNLYRHDTTGADQAMTKLEAECGLPLWQFGMSTWGFLNERTALAAFTSGGVWHLHRVDLSTGESDTIVSDYNLLSSISTDPESERALVLAASSQTFDRLCEYENDRVEPLYTNNGPSLPFGSISNAVPISFQTMNFQQAHGFYYPPVNPAYCGFDQEKPPLIVICHGGPTGSTSAALNVKIQYWTSRGFAVADINYRGSTGYGREYRLSLDGNWGVHDVDDACAAAEYCVDRGWADRNRLIIRGSSAGGYTVLSALCFRETFSAGCSLYGIGDLQALVDDTHKFESRYTYTLVSSPDNKDVYDARSPIQHVNQFNCPTIFFQGLNDKIVPPNQAHRMTDALDSAGIPVALVTYPNEAHGFGQAKTIVHALNAELAFYGAVFGFETDSTVTNLNIRNLDSHKLN